MVDVTTLGPVEVGLLALGAAAVLFGVSRFKKRGGQHGRYRAYEHAALVLATAALLAIALSVAARVLPHLTWV